ncbi:MAG: LacI family DNA-binding transcriptional regulator [Nocardioides sp.]|jgi:LacI family transcriptional regulator
MASRRRVTLSDVASRAGVSVTTASYILNGRASQMRISQDASSRVRAAAQELSYRPNLNARSLRTSQTSAIGVISDHVASGAYASQMLSGASAAARASDHVLIIGESEGNRTVEDRLVEELIDRQVDGMLYLTLTTSRVKLSPTLRQQKLVLLNCADETGRFSSVLPDEFGGGQTAARVLLDAGYADGIWIVGQDPDPFAFAGSLRLDGIGHQLGAAGVAPSGVVVCDWSVVPAYEAVVAMLETERPRALICLNDRIAMGAYQALAEHGLSVPHDVAVVSFDGSDLASWLRPRLTSVAIPYADLGAVAVELLLSGETATRRLPMPLQAGESV